MKVLKTAGVTRMMAVVLLLSVLPFNSRVFGQCNSGSTEGSDFWVMFLKNASSAANLSLIAAGDSNAVITVENPRRNWRTTANLTAGGHVVIPIPNNVANTTILGSVSNEGLHVTSTTGISLYASNFATCTYDIATVLPTKTLGTYYMSQDYPGYYSIGGYILSYGKGLLGVLAIEDNTEIRIVGFGRVFLMKGQTYQIQPNQLPYTFSGVEVLSNNKPFAMFQGNDHAFVPSYKAGDHVYEQSIPVDYWGMDFIVAPSAGRPGAAGNGDMVRITSSQDNCDVVIDGILVATNMRKGATYEAIVPYSRVNRIHTSKPSTVCLYLSGGEYGGVPGDPASVIIPPIGQGGCEAIFPTDNTSQTTDHYTNIIVATGDVPAMRMDGNSIASYFSPVDAVYSFAQIPVTPGTHSLQNQQGNFVAYCYGLGNYESYAYIASVGIENLGEGLRINGQRTRTVHDTVRMCVFDTANIQLITNSKDTSVLWYLDGRLLNVSQLSFKHHFNGVGAHRITAITHGLCGTLWCDTLEGVIKVVSPGVDTVHIPVCENEVVNYNVLTFKGPGIYQYSYTSRDVCDSIRVVVAYLRDTIRDTIHPVICVGGSFDTNGVSYNQQGIYTQHLRTQDSCFYNLVIDLTVSDTIRDTIHPVICVGGSFDTLGERFYLDSVYNRLIADSSICGAHYLTIVLTVNDTVRDTVHDTICDKTSYYFSGNVITEPGIYIDNSVTTQGCDSITVLFLEKLYVSSPTLQPDIEEICLGTEISRTDTGTETQGNTYRWVWDDGYTSTSHGGEGVSHTYSTPGTYNVRCEILAPNGCTDTSYFRVEVYEYARASFSWDPPIINTLSPDVEFHNLSQPHNPQYSTYLWQLFADTNSIETPIEYSGFEPEHQWLLFGINGGSYLIRLIAFTAYTKTDGSQLVCIDTAESSIYITNGFLQFPNVVTPNNDGINDIFEIKNLIDGKGLTDTELYIYNSWGRKVYHKKNISTREDFWDPAANNDPSGTYYYHFSAKGYTGNIQRNGAVQVLR